MSKGVNLIGYATSPTGLGEDLRSFASMLDYLGVPYSVIDVPTESRGRVQFPWQHLSTETFSTSFFFMSPMECLRLQEAQPKLFSEPKLKVGYFLWELPDFPDQYLKALDLVDSKQICHSNSYLKHSHNYQSSKRHFAYLELGLSEEMSIL